MLLGVTRQAISKWESEKAYPEMDKLLMICDLFGCTLDDLVLGDVRRPGQAMAGGGNANTLQSNPALSSSEGSGRRAEALPDLQSQPFAADGSQNAGSPSAAGNAGNADNVGDAGNVGNAGNADDMNNPGNANGAGGVYQVAKANVFNATSPLSNGEDANSAVAKDVTGYDAQMKSYAWKLALGVGAMIAGIAFAVYFPDPSTPLTDALSFLFISCGAVVGIVLVLLAKYSRRDFMKRHPYIEDFYTDDDRARGNIVFIAFLVGGLAAASLGIVVNQIGYSLFGVGDGDGGWPDTVMMLLFAVAVGCFIYGAKSRSMLKIDHYNRRCERREDSRGKGNHDFTDLRYGSQSSDMESSSDSGHSEKFYKRLSGTVCGLIMLVATLVGLLMLFLGEPTRMGPGFLGFPFWLSWPVGAVICAIADGIFRLVYAMRD